MVILFSVLNQAILWSSYCYPLYAPLDSVCWTFLKECLHLHLWAAAAKLLQSCPTLCNPIEGSPPGSPVPGILQARTREWVAISFSNAWKWKVEVRSLSCVWLFAIPWTAAYQAPPSMGFSRREYWSGVPLRYWSMILFTWVSIRFCVRIMLDSNNNLGSSPLSSLVEKFV